MQKSTPGRTLEPRWPIALTIVEVLVLLTKVERQLRKPAGFRRSSSSR